MSTYPRNIENPDYERSAAEEVLFGEAEYGQLTLFSGQEILGGLNRGLVQVGDALRQTSAEQYCRDALSSEERIAIDSIGLILSELGRFPKNPDALENLRHNIASLRQSSTHKLHGT